MQDFITGSRAPPQRRVLTTVLFTDIVGSTELVSWFGDASWGDLLVRHDRVSRVEVEMCGGQWIKSTGDGLLATFDSPSRAIRCACTLRDRLRDDLDVEVRAGLHAGEIELRGNEVGGIAVHLAARVQEAAAPSEVIVSSTVRDLVAGSGIDFGDRGVQTLKGVSGTCHLYGVENVSTRK